MKWIESGGPGQRRNGLACRDSEWRTVGRQALLGVYGVFGMGGASRRGLPQVGTPAILHFSRGFGRFGLLAGVVI